MAFQADTYRQHSNGAAKSGTELTQVSLSSLSEAKHVFAYTEASAQKPIVALGPRCVLCSLLLVCAGGCCL